MDIYQSVKLRHIHNSIIIMLKLTRSFAHAHLLLHFIILDHFSIPAGIDAMDSHFAKSVDSDIDNFIC